MMLVVEELVARSGLVGEGMWVDGYPWGKEEFP
jgi:hypothetical protein